jgi:hypothetical protein
MRFRRSGEIDENGDEDQKRIAEQAEKAEDEGDALTDHGGDFRGADIAEPGGKQRPQHPPAVHWKRRYQIEQREKQIHRRQPVDHADIGAFNCGEPIG